jgi:hypothetical protein
LQRANGDQSNYAAVFATALLDPERALPEGVVGPRRKAAARRYNVYRNNVTVSLIDALASIYPAVRRLTGDDFFRTLARAHIRDTPPTSPLLFEYGRDLPAFVEAYSYAQRSPWLADVARIERAWLDCYHAADAEPLAATALGDVATERLGEIVFRPHPAVGIVRSPFPACSIFAMARGKDEIVPVTSTGPEDALITRPEGDVIIRLLPPGGACFLQLLLAGHRLGDAATAVLDEVPDFDLPASIAGMIEAGVFSTIYNGALQ